MASWFRGLSLRALHETKKPVDMVSWFHDLSPSVDRRKLMQVSWFCALNLWDIEMTMGFMVSWFRGFNGFVHLDIEMTIGFMVS